VALYAGLVPYRVDLPAVGRETLDRLIELGALDVEQSAGGGIAALLPDSIAPDRLAQTLGVTNLSTSPAVGRDADSVWVLSLGPLRSGLRLLDTPAFGTGLHPTTALCLEAIEETAHAGAPNGLLDVGIGSGVLALSALLLDVPRAVGIDTEDEALRAAADNARLNGLHERLLLIQGGPDAVSGTWPLVVANVLAAPLIEMAPSLVRRVGHHGHLVLSGIPSSVEPDVERAYSRLGMRPVRVRSRGGWVAIELRATW
jgi:ribosomal protein L11 methylase PrmA